MTPEQEAADLLAELRTIRPRRDELQAQLDAIDGRRWDVFQRLKELRVANRLVAEAYGVSEPAVIQTQKKKRPQPQAERQVART